MEYTSSYTGAQIDAAVGKFDGEYLERICAIELNKLGSLSGYGGFIDFHYNGSSPNYTCRIIESAMGVLRFCNNIYVEGSAMLATDTGNVGIGTSSPSSKLDVRGAIRAAGGVGAGEYVSITTNNAPYISFTNDEIGCDAEISFNSDGRLHFENYDYEEYEFNGIVYAENYQSTSDMRKKNVISNITVDINDIANAPLFKFTWKDERKTGEHVGSSAQYWQEILPEAISVDKDPMQSLSMNYGAVALASAITTAKSVVNHEERIAALEKENALLKKEIEAIKAA